MLTLLQVLALGAAAAGSEKPVRWSPKQLQADVLATRDLDPVEKERFVRHAKLAGKLGLSGFMRGDAVLFTDADDELAGRILDEFDRTKAVLDELRDPPRAAADPAPIHLFHVRTHALKSVVADGLTPGPLGVRGRLRHPSLAVADRGTLVTADSDTAQPIGHHRTVFTRKLAGALIERDVGPLPSWLREGLIRRIVGRGKGVVEAFGDAAPIERGRRLVHWRLAGAAGIDSTMAPGPIDEERGVRAADLVGAIQELDAGLLPRMLARLRARKLRGAVDEAAAPIVEGLFRESLGLEWRDRFLKALMGAKTR